MSVPLKLISAGGVIVRQIGDTWEVLVLHRISPDEWRLPKGKAHPGESLEETARREVAEETGLKPEVMDYIRATGYSYTTRREGPVEKTVHYFLMQIPPDTPLRLEAHNFDASLWLPIDEAVAQLSFESERIVVRDARSKLPA